MLGIVEHMPGLLPWRLSETGAWGVEHDAELCATCQLHLDLCGDEFWDANEGEHHSPLHILRSRNSLKADGTYGSGH